MRINARLDEHSEKALQYLKQQTGLSVTEIVKHSFELYVQELESTASNHNRQLLEDLAGIANGPADLSERYKEYLSGSLNEKHPAG